MHEVIYGVKQAPRAWSERLHIFFYLLGLHPQKLTVPYLFSSLTTQSCSFVSTLMIPLLQEAPMMKFKHSKSVK